MAQLPTYKDADPAGLEKKVASHDDGIISSDDLGSVHSGEDILGLQDMDPALNMKMHLVNNVSRPKSCRIGVVEPSCLFALATTPVG